MEVYSPLSVKVFVSKFGIQTAVWSVCFRLGYGKGCCLNWGHCLDSPWQEAGQPQSWGKTMGIVMIGIIATPPPEWSGGVSNNAIATRAMPATFSCLPLSIGLSLSWFNQTYFLNQHFPVDAWSWIGEDMHAPQLGRHALPPAWLPAYMQTWAQPNSTCHSYHDIQSEIGLPPKKIMRERRWICIIDLSGMGCGR